MNSENVLQLFTNLLTKIEGFKNNQIDFGEGLLFYRREIHIIWAIYSTPGIHSSEIARTFGVTRAVTSKIIRKLIQQGYLYKETDASDKKCEKLYLTEKGKIASKAHYTHHQNMDRPLLEYMEGLDENQREVISDFLTVANDMIGKRLEQK